MYWNLGELNFYAIMRPCKVMNEYHGYFLCVVLNASVILALLLMPTILIQCILRTSNTNKQINDRAATVVL